MKNLGWIMILLGVVVITYDFFTDRISGSWTYLYYVVILGAFLVAEDRSLRFAAVVIFIGSMALRLFNWLYLHMNGIPLISQSKESLISYSSTPEKAFTLILGFLMCVLLISFVRKYLGHYRRFFGALPIKQLAKDTFYFVVTYLLTITTFAAIYCVQFISVGSAAFDLPAEEHIGLHDFFYFSVVTITTLGYGDIHPTHWSTEVTSAIQVLFGVVVFATYLGVTVSDLFSRYGGNAHIKSPGSSE